MTGDDKKIPLILLNVWLLSLDHHVGVVGEGIWAFHISRFLM
jgi:hypothetical protein